MPAEWQEAPLAELYDISSGLSKPASEFGSGHPFLSFKDVFYNYFVPNQLSDLVQSSEKEQVKCSVKRGDVFLTRTSETMHELGMSCVALKDYENATFNGFTKRLRPRDHNVLLPEYVGYYLRSRKFRNEMLAFSTMSTRASLNNGMIAQLCISYPDIETQKGIAWVLKTLDDKIELNRQMNATLEAMAQALFKSWFVDFDPVIDNALAAGNSIPPELQARAENRSALGDERKPLPTEIQQLFPSSFVFTEEMGWVPEGWVVKRVDKLMELAYGKSLPAKNRIDGLVPVYGSGGVSGFHSEALVKGPGIIVGRKGTVGSLYWVEQDFFPIDTVFYVENKSELPLYWLFQVLGTLRIEDMGADSAVPGVNRNAVYGRSVIAPSKSATESYETLLASINSRKRSLEKQNCSLTNLRDSLLPKLLSGQIQIPAAEQQLAEVV